MFKVNVRILKGYTRINGGKGRYFQDIVLNEKQQANKTECIL